MAVSGGRLGGIELSSGAWKTVYKPATGVLATVVVRFSNRAAAVRNVKLAQCQLATADPTPADGEMIFNSRALQASGDTDERDTMTLGPFVLLGAAGATCDQIVAQADGIDVDCTVTGVTET